MKADPADLVVLLELLGGGEACGPVILPSYCANALAVILESLPGRSGRRPIWSAAIEQRAMNGLRDRTPINVLARGIAEATGQSVPSVRRRLQEMNKRRRQA